MKKKFNQNNMILTVLIITMIIFVVFSAVNIFYIIYQNKIINSFKEENNKLTAKINEITGELIYSYNDQDKILSEKITGILQKHQISKTRFIKFIDYFEYMPFTYPLKDNSIDIIKGFGWNIHKKHKI